MSMSKGTGRICEPKYELCVWDSSQALGRQGFSCTCRDRGTTGQVPVLHTAKGTGGYTDLFSLSSLLIISVETGKELKLKRELLILCQQLHTVDWGCSEKNTNSF